MTDKALALADDGTAVGKPTRPRLQSVTVNKGKLTIAGSQAEHDLMDQALGSDSTDFQTYCLAQLLNILPEKDSKDYTFAVNAALVMLQAINPKDELEAMLAVQMVASNHMALLTTRKAVHSPTGEACQANGNMATKFSRTFVAQLEALGKHRRGGKQIVEHVHVNAGGQAVIANTVNTGRGA